MNTPTKLRLAALAAGLALTTAACGGNGGGTADVASLGAKNSDDNAAVKKTAASEDPEQAMLDFAKCMREHGIDMPDPQVNTAGDGMPAVAFKIGGDGADFSPEKMEEADKECRPLLGDAGPMGNISPEQQQEMQDKAIEHARCMREHGIDMPDPVFETGTGGGMVKMGDGERKAIDIDSQEFEDAQKACGGIFGNGGPVVSVSSGKVAGGKGGGGVIVSGATASAGSSK